MACKITIALAALLLPLAVSAQNTPEVFSLSLPISISDASADNKAAPYYRLTIPLAAYLQSAHADLRDLRVINANGQAVPFARLTPSGNNEALTRHEALPWFPLYAPADPSTDAKALHLVVKQSADGTLVELNSNTAQPKTSPQQRIKGYVLDASKLRERDTIRALDIDWKGKDKDKDNNFHLLDVETSDDLQTWRTVRSGVQLARLDYQGARIEQRRIALHGQTGRYLRLLWREPSTAPQLTAASVEQSSTHWRAVEPIWSAPLHANPNKTKDYTYRLPHALPITRVRLHLPEGNVLLPIEVLRPAHDKRPAQRLASSVLYRIESKGHAWTQDEIALSGDALDAIVIRIDPRSGPLPQALTLAFALNPEQVVFLASGKPPFTLQVGNRTARHSALTASTLIPGYGSLQAPEIGEAVVLNASAPSVETQQADEAPTRKNIILWGVLGLGVLGMGGMAFQLVKQMKASEPKT